MKDEQKSRSQLIAELKALRRQIARQKALIAGRKQTEQALAEKSMYLDNILRSATEYAIATTDLDFRITYYNPLAEQFFGYTAKEVTGKTVQEIHTKEQVSPERFEKAVANVRAHGEHRYQVVQESDKGTRYFDSRVSGIYDDPDGELIGFALFSRDVTERVQANEALRRYEQIISATDDHMAFLDRDYVYQAVNETYLKIHQKARREIVGHSIADILGADVFERLVKEKLDRCLAGEEIHYYAWFEFPGPGRRYMDVSYYPFFDVDGEVTGAVVSSHDITGRKQMEDALRESEFRYRALFEQANDAIFLENEDDQIIDANRKACELLGYSREELLNMEVADLRDPEVRGQPGSIVKYELERYGGAPFGAVNIHRDGARIPVEVSTSLVTNMQDGLYLSIVRDITERVQAEESLRESESLYHSLVESLPQNIFRKDVAGRFTFANRQFCKTQGKALSEIIGKTDFDIHPPELAKKYQTDDRRVIESGEIFETVEVHQPLAKEALHVKVVKIPVYDAAGQVAGIQGIFWDITERKQAEEALQARSRELTLLNSAGRAFVSSLELDQVLTTVLEQARRIIGIAACSIWLVDPQSGDLVCREVASPRDDAVRGWRLASGQGLAGWVLQRGESLNITDARTDKRHFKGVDKRTGLQLRSILGAPLRSKNKVFGALQLVDETENRFSPDDVRLAESLAALAAIAIENARLYEQTQQDAKTKTILLQEVNHRVKNNLAAITGMLYIERRHAKQSEDRRSYTDIMDDLVSRIQGLSTVHQLLSSSNWSPLPLSELARRVIDSALHALPPGRRVLVDVSSAAPVVVTPKEAHHLAIIINELTTNVVKYAAPARETTQITLRIALEPDGKTILFEFKDNGPGFPAAALRSGGRNVGMYLIENTARHSLRGEVRFYNDNGAAVIIKFAKEIESN